MLVHTCPHTHTYAQADTTVSHTPTHPCTHNYIVVISSLCQKFDCNGYQRMTSIVLSPLSIFPLNLYSIDIITTAAQRHPHVHAPKCFFFLVLCLHRQVRTSSHWRRLGAEFGGVEKF